MGASRAIFFGNSSLLIHCAEAFLEAGHAVVGVITSLSKIRVWAETSGITALSFTQVADSGQLGEFDFLFCVGAHQTVLPELIAAARKMAIRSHDSLCPPYLDQHGSNWALINQKAAHGVCWHEMHATNASGRVVRQQSFDVSRHDTAGSLYAKCYEASLASFITLLEDINSDRLQAAPICLMSEHRFTPSPVLPPFLGTLDFSRSAREVADLVRGLDCSPLPNNFAIAKIYLGKTTTRVHSAQAVLGAATSAIPGTVAWVKGDSLQVSTIEGDIILDGCISADERSMDLVVTAGMVLPQPDKAQLDQLSASIARIAQGELFWREVYALVSPVELAYPSNLSDTGKPQANASTFLRVPLRAETPSAVTLAAFLSWLSSITAQEQVSLMYADQEIDRQVLGLEAWLSGWVPLTLCIALDGTTTQAVYRAQKSVDQLRRAGPCASDLPARMGLTRELMKRLSHIGISQGEHVLLENMNLMLAINPDDQGSALVVRESVYSLAMLTTIAHHFSTFLVAFADGGSIAALSLIPADEASIAAAMNNTATPYDTTSSVQKLISKQALLTPAHVAVCFEGKTLTYLELEQHANALASRLRQQGVRPGAIVGLCAGRSIELVVGLLAIWKAGAAYLPLDPGYPPSRLLYMMEDSQAQLVLTTQALASSLPISPDKVCLLDAMVQPETFGPEHFTPLEEPVIRLAYLMYTSGSTGKPKGVLVTQKSLLNLFAGLNATIPHELPGRWLAVTSVSFDISVVELWWPLTHGLTVVIHSHAASGRAVAQALLHNEITHLFCTPSMVSVLTGDAAGRQALSGLSVLMAGGEIFPLQSTKELCHIVRGKVFNVYGPTEITVLSNVCELSVNDDFVPLGPPIANTTLSVRTPHGMECPAWVVGELLIGGDGVSNGYLHQPELTAEKFIADPARTGGRLYKTGDLVRRRPGGGLEFMGRSDHQVKIRGHRIELGEIEKTISKLSGVKEAVVLTLDDLFGDKRLVAYVVPQAGHTLEIKHIQAAIADALPPIMVPSVVQLMPSFQLTLNGKIDWRALPAPQMTPSEASAEDIAAMPESALEISMAKIWKQVLGSPVQVKATDCFFKLGGNFYLAVQVQRQLLKTTGHVLHLSDMVRLRTIRKITKQWIPNLEFKQNVTTQNSQLVSLDEKRRTKDVSAVPDFVVAPRRLTLVESAIARIWRDLFHLQHIDKHDDFFALGGNSLAAVRMFAQLRKQFLVDLPLAALFETSSLTQFAAVVAQNMQDKPHLEKTSTASASLGKAFSSKRNWSALVTICAGDARRQPLFCIHGAGGNVFNFKAVSQKLGSDQPIYGLQPQGVDGYQPMLQSIEAMATQYVKAIRTVDPQGPYQLIGYSAGGVIAFEMAQQLRKAGANITLLAMIDTRTPAAVLRKPGLLKKLFLMRHWSLRFALERLRSREGEDRRLDNNNVQVTQKLPGQWLPPEQLEGHLFQHIVDVQNRYKPEPYQGSIVLYKAKNATTHYLHAGERLGWEEYIDGQIKVVRIPGSHNLMMIDPNLTELSEALRQELNGLHLQTEISSRHESKAAVTPVALPITSTTSQDRHQRFG